ncbi:MAG: SWIM zinc finger family protein [Gammaproteobacteria bacterium]|nr:SWIM zinc finger family protein [Gammaproteobacteria bacterium]
MPITWTSDQVTSMAPDTASVKAGQKLGRASKWQTLGKTEKALWGEFKGSGSKPYQTCIEMTGPAFKCSCPSRKFPCKHALGLAYVFAEESTAMGQAQAPDWVSDWLEKREQRATRKANPKQESPADEATLRRREKAKQKRSESREQKVATGLEDLSQWIQDQARHGLARQDDSGDHWRKMAARMVDAQAPGLSRWIQRGADLRYQVDHWQEPLLFQLAKMHLLINAYKNKELLCDNEKADVDSLLGYTHNKEELMNHPVTSDSWWVMSQVTELESQLQIQRTWLLGQNSSRYAMLLDFAVANQVLPIRPGVGQCFEGELIYYPGSWPLRAVLKEPDQLQSPLKQQTPNAPTAFISIDTALQQYTRALAEYPWLYAFPMALSQVVPYRRGDHWYIQDTQNRVLELQLLNSLGWTLLSISGGFPVDIFGEWDLGRFKPLTVYNHQEAHNLVGLQLEMMA